MSNVKISVIRSLLDEYSSHCGVSAGVFLKEYADLLESIDKAEPVKYQYREIGESDWRDCTKEQYEYAKTVPELDYRTVTQSPIDERAEVERCITNDLAYLNGLEAGWNLGVSNDNKAFDQIRLNRSSEIKQARQKLSMLKEDQSETEQSIKADAFDWIANHLNVPPGSSVQEYVAMMARKLSAPVVPEAKMQDKLNEIGRLVAAIDSSDNFTVSRNGPVKYYLIELAAMLKGEK